MSRPRTNPTINSNASQRIQDTSNPRPPKPKLSPPPCIPARNERCHDIEQIDDAVEDGGEECTDSGDHAVQAGAYCAEGVFHLYVR